MQAELHQEIVVHERPSQNDIQYRYNFVLPCLIGITISSTYLAASANTDVPLNVVTGRAPILGNVSNGLKRPQTRQPAFVFG